MNGGDNKYIWRARDWPGWRSGQAALTPVLFMHKKK